MIPRQLQISGFLSYREPVTIDFTQIHVACISGSNGAGKSALLDAMTWALFGEARKNDDSIINNARSVKKAEVIFDFDYESGRYRIVRSKEIGKSTAADLLIWNQETEIWRSMSDKTVRLTNKRIVDLLHLEYETFINASFFLQGKADQFTSQNASNRKQILGNILDLDIWERYQLDAAEKRKEQASRLIFLESRLDELERELSEEPVRVQALAELEEALRNAEQVLNEKQHVWQQAKSVEALLTAKSAAYQSVLDNFKKTAKTLEQDQKRLSDRTLESQNIELLLHESAAIEKGYQQYQTVRSELAVWNQKAVENFKLVSRMKDLNAKIGQTRAGLESEQNALRQEQNRLEKDRSLVPVWQHKQSELQLHLDQLQKTLEEKDEIIRQTGQVTDAYVEKSAENQQLKKQMLDLKGRIDQLEAADRGTPCPFCGKELDEEHTADYLEEMQLEGKVLGDRFRSNSDELNALKQEKAVLDQKTADIQTAEFKWLELSRTLAPIAADLKKFEESEPHRTELTGRLNEIETLLTNQTYAEDEKRDLAALQSEMIKLAYDEDTHNACRDHEAELSPLESKWQQVQNARAQLQPIQREISELELRVQNSKKDLGQLEQDVNREKAELDALGEIQPDLQIAKKEYDQVQAETNRIRSDKGAAEQRVSVLVSLKAQRKEVLAEREAANYRISQLKYLEKAFSKNGIPAVLIDQALPEIEEHANMILGKLTDERMSVRFSTQEDYKDKSRETKKETLAIYISDETGTREYEMFSGGEAFRVNFAIRLALSHILTRRAGARLQMLVIDEGFGSQDAEGRQRLVESITAVQNDFEMILVITHLDELKDVFPSRIEVEKTAGGSQVHVIP